MSKTILELIRRRRLQLLVHSIIYYKLGENIVSDGTWASWGLELEELQAKYPDISEQAPYAEAFRDFDHSTGMNLPLEDPWALNKARQLLNWHKKGIL